MTRALTDVLAETLSDLWGAGAVEIRDLARPTAGAHREIHSFVAVVGDRRRKLVATLMPEHIQGNPATAEAGIIRLAAEHGVPVPAVHAVVEDAADLGRAVIISDFIAGESIPRRVLRLAKERGTGRAIIGQLGHAMARLHGIDVARAPVDLRSYPDAPSPASAALAAVRESVGGLESPRPVLELGLLWLERNLPHPIGSTAIVHTDVRNGNIIVDDDGLAAVLDWERAIRGGDPMEDLAWAANRMWRFGVDDLEVGGLGGRSDLVEAYEAEGGTFDVARFEWWKVLWALRWALGLADLARPVVTGTSDNIVWAASGRRIPEVEWDLLMLLRRDMAAGTGGGARR
ncbi:phosphotransferase family protein [Georgenia sp. SYP-B2076]|uniref:phosphotransferase family protein n=1 Tax=Georgenia sp. SYP-B2076 TaxID=2495881 RepID=UPI00197AEF38|nr:phosphotransferase family protein [Georgenia sp. SYP-B2076]